MNTLRAISKISLIRFRHNDVIKISGCLVGKQVPPTFKKGLDMPIEGIWLTSCPVVTQLL